jgi:hypothetical protein
MQRGSSALLCLTLCAAIVVTPALTNIGDHDLYNSAWAKGSGKGNEGNGNGGNGGGSNNGQGNNSGGRGHADGGGKSTSGKSPSSSVAGSGKAKSKQSNADSVTMAQKALAEAIQAFEAALAEPGTNTNTLLRLERAITVAENSLRKASAKAAAGTPAVD